MELSSKLDWASASATPFTAVPRNASETHPRKVSNIVKMEIATEERYQLVLKRIIDSICKSFITFPLYHVMLTCACDVSL